MTGPGWSNSPPAATLERQVTRRRAVFRRKSQRNALSCRTRTRHRPGWTGWHAHSPSDGPSAPVPGAFSGTRALDATVLRLALNAAACARDIGAVANDRLLTVIDYSRASTSRASGCSTSSASRCCSKSSSRTARAAATTSRRGSRTREGSHQTSLGLFRTADTYVGSNGYSLRLDGLEPGVNDRARERAIVMHGAPVRQRGEPAHRGPAGPQPWLPGAPSGHRAHGNRHHQAGLARVRLLPRQAVAAGLALPQRLFLNHCPKRMSLPGGIRACHGARRL